MDLNVVFHSEAEKNINDIMARRGITFERVVNEMFLLWVKYNTEGVEGRQFYIQKDGGLVPILLESTPISLTKER